MKKPEIPQHIIEGIKNAVIYGVGYSSPPREHQFKKGQSGNPKGRPRKNVNSNEIGTVLSGSNAAIISRVFHEPVTILRNGRRHKVPKAEFIQRTIEKQAANGSVNAAKRLHDQAYAEDAAAAASQKDVKEFWLSYIAERATALNVASQNKLEPSRYWIDPEDIVFVPDGFVRIKGAESAKDVADFEALERFRNLLIVEIVHLARIGSVSAIEDTVAFPLLARIEFHLSQAANRRGQALWDELQDVDMMLRRNFLARRRLIWQALGIQNPLRQFPFPKLPVKYKSWLARQVISPEEEINDMIRTARIRKRESQKHSMAKNKMTEQGGMT
jgi:Family of unknown function (DUF5681)